MRKIIKSSTKFSHLITCLLVSVFASLSLGYAQKKSEIEKANEFNTGASLEYYVYFTEPTGSFEKVVEVLPDHMDFVHKIESEKTMVMGGQTTNEGADDAGGYGMIVIRASSFEEARKIADQDPMHKTGVRKYTLFKWNINEGFLNIKYKLSDQTFTVE